MSGFKRGAANIRPAVERYPAQLTRRWFFASYCSGECSDCGSPIMEGDRIRPDGSGGWECATHDEEDR